ncbi:disease resistance protein RPV1-like [Quercus robur]|uniref:disease resistance protein RPV1-like n=1 Tax=Quercus robur TaxID=38942 RepID=UPI002161CC04|nr:disease resistance protein RPV1-like [Quercus robur]
MDDELQSGKKISTKLLEAIESSKISIIVFSKNYTTFTWCLNELVKILEAIESSKILIIVFSKNYATSTWCLNELVKILECKKNGQILLPVFYKVDPSEVRSQSGKFGEALEKHEQFKDNINKVQRWKAALNEAGNLSVGIDSRIAKISWRLDIESNDVRMLVIHGLPGIGSSFLEDVRENSKTNDGVLQLQEALYSKILGGRNLKVHGVSKRINVIMEKLHHKRILLILDDVEKLVQVENLLGNCWFASGSRIIITTREEKLLSTL